MRKKDIIDIVLDQFTTTQNKEFLWKFVAPYNRMSEDEWNEFLEKNGITTWSDLFKGVEDYLSTLSETRIGPAKRIYTQRIYEDENLRNIIERAFEIKNPTPLRKSYYIAHELSKLLGEDPKKVFIPESEQIRLMDEPVSEDYEAICKSSSELYVDMLREVGVYAELIRKQLDSKYPHVETIVFDGDKKYDVNLIQHFMQVQTNKLMWNFGKPPREELYRDRIEDIYGELSQVPSAEIRQMDEEFGFVKKENGKSTYFSDKVNNYLRDQKEKMDQMSTAEMYEKAPEIMQDYLSFIRRNESFSPNCRFQEIDYHYINTITKGMNKLKIGKKRGLDIRLILGCKGEDLNNLFGAWRIEAGEGQIKYFIYGNGPMQDISKEELQEIFRSKDISLVERGRAPVTDRRKIDKILEGFFEDGVILRPPKERQAKRTSVVSRIQRVFARMKNAISQKKKLPSGTDDDEHAEHKSGGLDKYRVNANTSGTPTQRKKQKPKSRVKER